MNTKKFILALTVAYPLCVVNCLMPQIMMLMENEQIRNVWQTTTSKQFSFLVWASHLETMLSFGKIFAGFLLCIAYYLITYHFLEDLLNLNTSNENSSSHPFHPLITLAKPSNGKEPPWRSYHNYAAIPSFYSLKHPSIYPFNSHYK